MNKQEVEVEVEELPQADPQSTFQKQPIVDGVMPQEEEAP